MHAWLLSLQGASPSLGNQGQQLQLSVTISQPLPRTIRQQAAKPLQPKRSAAIHPQHTPVQQNSQTVAAQRVKHRPLQTAQVRPNPQKHSRTTHSDSNALQPAITQASDVTEPKQTDTSTEVNSATQQAHLLASQRLIQSQLQQALRPHFYYPAIAVRRGWQGAVRLGLRIQSNGELLNVRVVSSSGYGILDRAALNSLQRVKQLPSAIAVLNGKDMDVVLPVSFKLL